MVMHLSISRPDSFHQGLDGTARAPRSPSTAFTSSLCPFRRRLQARKCKPFLSAINRIAPSPRDQPRRNEAKCARVYFESASPFPSVSRDRKRRVTAGDGRLITRTARNGRSLCERDGTQIHDAYLKAMRKFPATTAENSLGKLKKKDPASSE